MPKKYSYKSFISYSGEEREVLVEPLAAKFRDIGLKVWFDDFELKPGDSLSKKISEGLNSSEYGICIFSPSFVKKPWPKFELQGMISLLLSNKLKIIPIWFNLNLKEVQKLNPSLADIVAVKSDGRNINEVFFKILQVISPVDYENLMRKLAHDRVSSETQEKSVTIEDIKDAPIRHKTLSESAISRAKLICRVLADADLEFMSLDKFLDSLKRDTHYENELLIWEGIAGIYLENTRKYILSKIQKKKLVSTIIGVTLGAEIKTEKSGGGKKGINIKVKVISDAEIKKALEELKK